MNRLKSYSRNGKSSPKYAICNCIVMSNVLKTVMSDKEITAEMHILLASIYSFRYMFAYSAGVHKAIDKYCSFFKVDLSYTSWY